MTLGTCFFPFRYARFTQTDVQPFSESILLAMFRNIESGGTPEKIAENDYLMKCEFCAFAVSGQRLAD